MPFEKGHSKSGGRKKGVVNKKTSEWKEMGEWIINEGIQAYKDNLMDLMNHKEADIRLKAMDKFNALIEYFKPKLSRAELIGDEKKPLSLITEFKIPDNERE